MINKIYGVSFYQDKRPLMYRDMEVNTRTFVIYDGTKEQQINKEQYKEYRQMKTSPYVLVKCGEKEDLKEAYDTFVKNADMLYKFTKKKINLYRTGDFSKSILYYFFTKMNKLNICPDPIGEEEAIWCENATKGSLMYATDGYKGKAYAYDFSSWYLSLLGHRYFKIPLRAGKFHTYTEKEFEDLEFYVNTYIYRVKALPPPPSPIESKNQWKKLVRYNVDHHSNTYSYWVGKELTFLKKLGFTFEIYTGGANCLMYDTKECGTGKNIFRDICQFLYKIKQNPTTKEIGKKGAVCLWGGLCAGNNITMSFKNDEPIVIGKMIDGVMREKEIIHIHQQKNRTTITWRDHKAGIYQYNWARLKPFLKAWDRVQMGEFLLPMVQHVIRIHTDGFMLGKKISKDIKVIPKGEPIDMGQLKYEGWCKEVHIKNLTNIKGEFKLPKKKI